MQKISGLSITKKELKSFVEALTGFSPIEFDEKNIYRNVIKQPEVSMFEIGNVEATFSHIFLYIYLYANDKHQHPDYERAMNVLTNGHTTNADVGAKGWPRHNMNAANIINSLYILIKEIPVDDFSPVAVNNPLFDHIRFSVDYCLIVIE